MNFSIPKYIQIGLIAGGAIALTGSDFYLNKSIEYRSQIGEKNKLKKDPNVVRYFELEKSTRDYSGETMLNFLLGGAVIGGLIGSVFHIRKEKRN